MIHSSLWRKWVVYNVIGASVGSVTHSIVSSLFYISSAYIFINELYTLPISLFCMTGGILGGIIGISQETALKPLLQIDRNWVLMCILSFTFSESITIFSPSNSRNLIAPILLGLFLGLSQGYLLRGKIPRPGKWFVAASSAGLILGSVEFLISIPFAIILRATPGSILYLFVITITRSLIYGMSLGIIMSVATGLVLVTSIPKVNESQSV